MAFSLLLMSNSSSMSLTEKEYMKMIIGKVVDNMTQGHCIPTDSVKSGDNHSNLVHNTGAGIYTDSDKANTTYLVS